MCCCSGDLVGKTVVLTGGTSGIGLTVATEIAKRGALIIFTARNLSQGTRIRDKIIAQTGNPNVICKQLDLNDFSSIQTFVSQLQPGLYPNIDILINNAGIFFHPPEKTIDGYDVTFQTNYLGILCTGLHSVWYMNCCHLFLQVIFYWLNCLSQSSPVAVELYFCPQQLIPCANLLICQLYLNSTLML